MPEIRKNIVTGELVIIAPERAQRPVEHQLQVQKEEGVSSNCPFCPGNEEMTPPSLYQAPSVGSWRVRSVPNKFSVLSAQGDGYGYTWDGLYPRREAVGPHEVIIEGTDHSARFWEQSKDTQKLIVGAWHNRINDFHNQPDVQHVVLFKNHGPAAGSSLAHPHSQIVGLPALPDRFELRKYLSLRHQQVSGECLMCEMITRELSEKSRLVVSSKHFVAFVPFAAFSPFHIWIVPLMHSSSFANCSPDELSDFSYVLSTVLNTVDSVGARPDFNLVFLGDNPKNEATSAAHWYVSVVGRTTKSAGFELGTGMYINPSLPEAQAELLRSAAAHT